MSILMLTIFGDFQLRRSGGSWTALPYDYPIGASSIQLSGSSTFEPAGLELRPAEL